MHFESLHAPTLIVDSGLATEYALVDGVANQLRVPCEVLQRECVPVADRHAVQVDNHVSRSDLPDCDLRAVEVGPVGYLGRRTMRAARTTMGLAPARTFTALHSTRGTIVPNVRLNGIRATEKGAAE